MQCTQVGVWFISGKSKDRCEEFRRPDCFNACVS